VTEDSEEDTRIKPGLTVDEMYQNFSVVRRVLRNGMTSLVAEAEGPGPVSPFS